MSLLAAVFASMSGTSATVTLAASYSVFGLDTGFGDASAVFRLESDGDIVTDDGFGATDVGDWLDPKASAPGAYEVRATLNSGTLSSGTTGSWLALTSTREWAVSQIGVGSITAGLTIEIRLGGTTLDSATVTLSADVF